ncbi:ABC transporter ATP-binding protein [Muriicola sp. Z0-33]|nr:ABC transporter ATP-binding protein [Muriicola sp. Z0-33]
MSATEEHITLKVRNLNIGYQAKNKNTLIAEDIHFDLARGQLAAIVGINGIGKSTLLRTLGAVQPRISGDIRIHDKALESYSSTQLAEELSLVLTESVASKNLTVRELIGLGRQPYTNWIGTLSTKDQKIITNAIQRVGLENIASKKCYELSDGQLQKVMVARALAQDTAVMFLDEPTTHLDLFHKVQIIKLLRSIAHETGKTILYTTHEIELAIQLCDKMLIMEQGKSTFGAPCDLIEQKSFEALFPAETILFDPNTGSFRIQN